MAHGFRPMRRAAGETASKLAHRKYRLMLVNSHPRTRALLGKVCSSWRGKKSHTTWLDPWRRGGGETNPSGIVVSSPHDEHGQFSSSSSSSWACGLPTRTIHMHGGSDDFLGGNCWVGNGLRSSLFCAVGPSRSCPSGSPYNDPSSSSLQWSITIPPHRSEE
jgi:hypothetical protein